jgi:hypothetical protein
MALVVNDRVKETTTIVGTGTATLLGLSPGYQSFSVIGNGNTTYYCIADQGSGLNWEVGIGTYTSIGTTLSRTTVLASSNANALVSFAAGTKDVFVTYPAGKGIWLDASGNAIGLGTPSAFIATNVTGLPLTTGVTGTLPIANGGTGVTTSTGSGSVVLNTSPALVTPALGTPSSGTLTNCTFPTLNQNTTGTASNITAYTVNQNVGTANSPSFPSITTTSNLSIQIGGSASIGFYQDATNTAIRTTASGSIYMQNASGTTTYGYFNSNGLNGNVQGNVSGSSGSCTGNAATATNATNATNYFGGTGYTVGNTAAFAGANDTTLSIRGTSTTAATMSFHRPGAYAANFGIDTDNVLKYGGWSAGTVYPVYHGGNPQPSVSGSSGSCTGNAATASNALGYNQTWQNVTGSRASGTTYTNSTGRPIMVAITAYNNSAPIYINGVQYLYTLGYAASYGTASFVVPAGATYSATLSSNPLWSELR